MRLRIARSVALGAALLGIAAGAAAGETLGTLTLDALSFVSFQDREILSFPSGSTIRFHFGEPAADGSVPFSVAPGDVSIGPIPLGDGSTLLYGLASATSGTMEPTATGRRMTFTATVRATRDAPGGGGTLTYTVPFTTETASATNAAGTASVSASGMRLVEGVWHVQIVGAATNRTDALPQPGTAVYTVLSGQFDQVP